jgi:hypothetical protein
MAAVVGILVAQAILWVFGVPLSSAIARQYRRSACCSEPMSRNASGGAPVTTGRLILFLAIVAAAVSTLAAGQRALFYGHARRLMTLRHGAVVAPLPSAIWAFQTRENATFVCLAEAQRHRAAGIRACDAHLDDLIREHLPLTSFVVTAPAPSRRGFYQPQPATTLPDGHAFRSILV